MDRRLFALAVIGGSAAACGMFPSLAGLSETAEGGFDAGDAFGGDDSGIPSDGSLVDLGTPLDAAACPSLHGPAMIRVDDHHCIDSTEFLVSDYLAFMAANPDAGAFPQIALCSWNATFTPNGTLPSANKATYPMNQINWCQAYAFCQWSGKELCGSMAGGAGSFADFADASSSAWMNACSRSGTVTYPYGNTFQPGYCDIPDDAGAGSWLPYTKFGSCIGGYPDLFNMIGDVSEWENACTGSAGAKDVCRRRGSAFDDTATGPTRTCAYDETDTRDHQSATSGARCCATLP